MDTRELFELHESLGKLLGKFNWATCRHSNNDFYLLKTRIDILKRRIDDAFNYLSMFMDESDLNDLNVECDSICKREQNACEILIERDFRPANLFFNKNALIVYTDKPIPEDIQIGLSFGNKFLFPYFANNDNMHELMAQLEMTIEDAIPDLRHLEACAELKHIFKRRSLYLDDTKSWLYFISKRTASFFKDNPDIIAIKSDKGAHTVVINVLAYEAKLDRLLSDSAYVTIDINPLQFLIEREVELVNSLKQLPQFGHISFGFQSNILLLSKFYGLPKIHKNDIPLRPITSMVNAPGYFLGKVFYRVLDTVFPRTRYHIKDSYEFVNFIRETTIKHNDILVSFDVVSMYTSIPFEISYDIIMAKADLFFNRFGIERRLLSNILIFLLEESSVFTALGHVYKQKDGLPMGSCLSPLIARIVMDEIIKLLLSKVSLTFVRVFVDDTVAAVDKRLVARALDTLNSFAPNQIKFTLEKENDNGSINFLNVTLMRNGDTIKTNWYRKSFASGRLLNYFSSHKWTIILGTAAHFIKTVLFLSDPDFYHQNRERVIETLRINSFPEITIITLMNTYYTFMRPVNKCGNNADKQYVIFPHSISHNKQVRNVISNFKNSDIVLADSVKNTKVNFIKTPKAVDSITSKSNLVLSSKCMCDMKCIVEGTGYNETGKMTVNRLRSHVNRCTPPNHCYKTFKLHKGLQYNRQTKYLLRYTQWMHRHKLDLHKCSYHFPITRLCDLVKCKCCRN